MAAFIPGASPPLVSNAIFFMSMSPLLLWFSLYVFRHNFSCFGLSSRLKLNTYSIQLTLNCFHKIIGTSISRIQYIITLFIYWLPCLNHIMNKGRNIGIIHRWSFAHTTIDAAYNSVLCRSYTYNKRKFLKRSKRSMLYRKISTYTNNRLVI